MTKKISPAQAILKLIKHYRRPENASKKRYLGTLYRLYLDGAVNPEWRFHLDNFSKLHKDDVLKSFKISFEPQIIDNDPTKRYFETHLAFESIKNATKKVSLDSLQYFSSELSSRLLTLDNPRYIDCDMMLNGLAPKNDNELIKEYADYFSRINKNKLFTSEQGFSDSDREKIVLIIACSFLSVSCAQSSNIHPLLPLDIYEKDAPCYGFFGNNKGKILKPKNDAGLSQHYGMIKGHMPLSRDDIASSDSTFNFLKSSEQSRYDEHALWVKINFYQLVHPFSNSISGSLLCLIRNLCYLQNYKIFPFTDSLEVFDNFIKLFSSTLLFFSGGHSLHELIYVLRLPEVVGELQHKHSLNHLDLSSAFISRLFLQGNETAFEKALQKTIEYNNQYIKRDHLNTEIIKGIKLKPIPDLTNLNNEKKNSSLSNCSELFPKKRKVFEKTSTTEIRENNKKLKH